MNYAPVAVFVYNRLDHTKRTIEALLNNELAEKSDIFVFSDGPKYGDEDRVNCIREYLKGVHGFGSITIIERGNNWGLSRNIVSGVSQLSEMYGRVIVIEDDIITSPLFLTYMNTSLEIYENDLDVMCVSGCSYLKLYLKEFPQVFFVKGKGECWGWATWRRAWEKYYKNPGDIIKRMSLREAIRFDAEGGFIQVMLNYLGLMDTWAVFWDYCIYENSGKCLHVRDSLVCNIGFDGSGDHCGDGGFSFDINTPCDNESILSYLKKTKYNSEIDKLYTKAIKKHFKTGVIRRSVHCIRWLKLYYKCIKRIKSE